MEAETLTPFTVIPVAAPADGPFVAELVPAPEPWEVARRFAALPHLLVFDSAEHHHAERGRYSYVTAAPAAWQTFRGTSAAVGEQPRSFVEMQRLLSATSITPGLPDLPPFQGGLAFALGYELNAELEQIPRPRYDEFRIPQVAFGLYGWVVSFDHVQRRAWLVQSRAIPADHFQNLVTLLQAQQRPHARRLSGHHVHASALAPQFPLAGFNDVTSNFNRAGYEATVARVIEYIQAGDCYQVNLAQRLLAPLRDDPLELYHRLRRRSPAPFGAYFDIGEFQILSASPERFLKVTDGEVETRPIKGTRPRGCTASEDAAFRAELSSSAKDRAENVMIVDLLRNDIGKVCEYGSVRVPRVCALESFRQVHHLVSEVRGRLRSGQGPLDLLAAAFPGGSITGAPKVRAMQIIAELEPTARGLYCGSLGYIGFDGSMDSNILIRTFTVGGGWVQFPVGGGIVADSEPHREYEETLHKAAGLLHALAQR